MNKTIISVVLALVITGAIWGAYKYPQSTVQNMTVGAVGDTNSTSRIASVSADLSTTTPTTFNGACSLYNSDSKTRVISSVDFYGTAMGVAQLNGTGPTNLIWQMSTSTGIYVPSSTNYLLYTSVATTAPQIYVASTSPGQTATVPFREWASGSCLNLLQNATSTATSTIVVRYFINN